MNTPETQTDPHLLEPLAELPSSASASPGASGAAGAMTMLEHLAELRQRIIICVLAAAMGILAAFFYALPIIEILKAMASPVVLNAHGMVEFVQLTPGEVLMASLKLSVCLGLAAASPIMLYQILRFVMPGLNQREKWQLLWVVLAGALLFVSGVAFSYFLVVPSALGYLLEYGQQVAKSQISIAQYVDFCLSLLLLSGVVFELPLLLFFLSLIGLLSSGLLLSQWRQAMVGVALAAAVLTPSQDPLTMIIVGCAMAGLYFLSVVPIRLSGR